MSRLARSIVEATRQFWLRVDRSAGPDACWPWLGSDDGRGYGAVWWFEDGRGRMEKAHRVAYRLEHGVFPRPGGLHQCDNSICANPSHVRPGDQRQNMADAKERGRTTAGRCTTPGSTNGNAKLTELLAVEIHRRLELGDTKIGLSREFKVSRATVQFIAKRKRWRRAIELAA